MAIWRLSNREKRSYLELITYTKGESTITRLITWRWGSFTIESDEKPEFDLENGDGLNIFDNDLPYEIEFEEASDGDHHFSYSDDMSQEEIDKIESLIEEVYDDESEYEDDDDTDGFGDSIEKALIRLGWNYDDTEQYLVGSLELELIEN